MTRGSLKEAGIVGFEVLEYSDDEGEEDDEEGVNEEGEEEEEEEEEEGERLQNPK
jgi:hypothetical protein